MGGIVELRADDNIRANANRPIIWPPERTRSLGRRCARRCGRARVATIGDPSSATRVSASFYRVLHERSNAHRDGRAAGHREQRAVRAAVEAVPRAPACCVPEVVASDIERGFLLVSDLGELMYSDRLRHRRTRCRHRGRADTLITIARVGDADGVVPPYTRQRLHDELELFKVWLVDGLLRHVADESRRGHARRRLAALIESADGQSKVCVHRDFHSRNLLWGPDRVTRVVDFQDALLRAGACTTSRRCCATAMYVSTRPRSRVGASAFGCARPGRGTAARGRRRRALPRQLDMTAMQRQLKALGIFSRLELRDARPSHLVDIAPVLDHLIDVARDVPGLRAIRRLARRNDPARSTHRAAHARGVECAE